MQVLVIGHQSTDPTSPATPMDLVAASVLRAIDQHGLRRVITFHGRVGKAQAFAAGLDGLVTPDGTPVAARHVFGGMPAAQRVADLEWLAGDVDAEVEEARIVSNARCLSEGIDVPAVDGVVFADRRSSVIDIIQAIGRVLRPAPGKAVGTIVLPVAVEHEADMDTELSLSAFGQVWTVLRALRAHDHRLDAELVAMHRAQVRGDGNDELRVRAPSRLLFDLPSAVDLPELELRLADETGSTWDRNLVLLEQWAEENPGRIMPRLLKVTYGDETVGLGEWAEQQRIARRRGVLSQERVDRLAQVPGWVWDKSAARWEATVDKLRAYVAEHGT
ncbi:MAG: Helicase associated domain protein, partial [Pseudonocardiaceae bacterium]